MKRENRYLVIKRNDLAIALKILKPELEANLDAVLGVVDMIRKSRGKAPLCCVVVEHDWPEYEPTWKAIEERVDNTCEHGKLNTEYCLPCGRIHGSNP